MVNIIDQKRGFCQCYRIGNCDKNIDEISKTRHSINNLTEYQKYQTGFVLFDAESNFEYIYPVFTLL